MEIKSDESTSLLISNWREIVKLPVIDTEKPWNIQELE